MRPLNDRSRCRLLAGAAVLCAVPMLLIPLAGRSAFEVNDEQFAFVQRFKQLPRDIAAPKTSVKIARDPFLGDLSGQIPIETRVGGDTRVVGMRVVQGAPMGIDVPNAVTVRAIVSGKPPRALVEVSGHVRVVGPGDALAGSMIRRIDRSGVLLQNGVLLMLAEHEQ